MSARKGARGASTRHGARVHSWPRLARQEDKAQSAEAAAGLRGTLCARDAELAAAREAVAASAAARQAAMDEAAGGRAELDALRCELDKVGQSVCLWNVRRLSAVICEQTGSTVRGVKARGTAAGAQARAAAGGIDALSKDLLHSRLRECEVAALRERAETAEAGLVRVYLRARWCWLLLHQGGPRLTQMAATP